MSIPILGRLHLADWPLIIISFLLAWIEFIISIITNSLPSVVIDGFTVVTKFIYRFTQNPINLIIGHKNDQDEEKFTYSYVNPNLPNLTKKQYQTMIELLNADRIEQMAQLFGYEVESRILQTKDNYLLNIFRIKGGERPRNGKVVYLHHGLLMNCEIWCTMLEKYQNLPFLLYDLGYDVWLGNNRGSKYSQRHLYYKSNSKEFWDFSLDEFALFDIPNTIDYILQVSGVEKLTYIGFSQGSAQAFASVSVNIDLNQKIDQLIAISPATTPHGLYSKFLDILLKSSPNITYLMFSRKVLMPSCLFWQKIMYPPLFDNMIDISNYWLFNWKAENIDKLQKLSSYAHLYSTTSVKCVVHWFQVMSSKNFQMYHDSHTTLSGLNPISYPLKNIQIPIHLIYGSADSLVDIEVMKSQLPDKTTTVHPVPNYEHLDNLWGRNAAEYVFKEVLHRLGENTEDLYYRLSLLDEKNPKLIEDIIVPDNSEDETLNQQSYLKMVNMNGSSRASYADEYNTDRRSTVAMTTIPFDELHPDALVRKISQRIPRSLPSFDNYYHAPVEAISNSGAGKEDPIVKELQKLYPHKAGTVTYKLENHEENEIVIYSNKLQELLYLLVEEKHLDDNIRISIESSLFDMTCYLPDLQSLDSEPEIEQSDQKLSKRQKTRKQNIVKPAIYSYCAYPNHYRSKIVIDNYEYLIKFSSTYFNLSLASHITKFMVELFYSLNYWEVVHLVYMNPSIIYFLKLCDFEIVETSFGPLIKPPENYLCDEMLSGLQYPFPYPFYNYSYHSFDSKVERDKFNSVKVSPYLDISLKQQDLEPVKKKKKRGRKPKVRVEENEPVVEEEEDDEELPGSKQEYETPPLEQSSQMKSQSQEVADEKDLSTTEEIQSVKEDSVKQEPQPLGYYSGISTPITLPSQSLNPHPQPEQSHMTGVPPPPPPQVYGPTPSLAMYAMSRPPQYPYYQYQQQHLPPQQHATPPQPQESGQFQGASPGQIVSQQSEVPVQSEFQPGFNQRYEYRPGDALPSINKLTDNRQDHPQQLPIFPFQNQLKFIPQSPNRAGSGSGVPSSGGAPLAPMSGSSISPTIGSPQSTLVGSPHDGESNIHSLLDPGSSSYIIDDKGKKKPGVIHQCHLTDPATMSKCLKIFYGKNELLRHQEFVHATKKKIYKCIYCSRTGAKVQSYPRHDSLARHIRRKHGVTGKENKLAVNYAKENVEIIDESQVNSQLITQPYVEPLPHPGFLNRDYSVKDSYTGGFWSFRSKGSDGEGSYGPHEQGPQQQQSQQVISPEVQQGRMISLPPLGPRDESQYQGSSQEPTTQPQMPMYVPLPGNLVGAPEYRSGQSSSQVESSQPPQSQSQGSSAGRTSTVLPSMQELDSSHSFGIHSRPFPEGGPT
ncbi:Sterol esterase TGL1 [Spathaspora sp. JA1]|nr:Sterol esterase TGL1 [Spathaspora sp. JA1]